MRGDSTLGLVLRRLLPDEPVRVMRHGPCVDGDDYLDVGGAGGPRGMNEVGNSWQGKGEAGGRGLTGTLREAFGGRSGGGAPFMSQERLSVCNHVSGAWTCLGWCSGPDAAAGDVHGREGLTKHRCAHSAFFPTCSFPA